MRVNKHYLSRRQEVPRFWGVFWNVYFTTHTAFGESRRCHTKNSRQMNACQPCSKFQQCLGLSYRSGLVFSFSQVVQSPLSVLDIFLVSSLHVPNPPQSRFPTPLSESVVFSIFSLIAFHSACMYTVVIGVRDGGAGGAAAPPIRAVCRHEFGQRV